VACSKCDWRAAFSRDELIASHGSDYAMPNLLNHLAAPSCKRLARCELLLISHLSHQRGGYDWAGTGDFLQPRLSSHERCQA
jgi:hypothetical protein